MRIKRQSRFAAIGFVSGVACGALVWSRMQHSYRKDLFSRHPVRRFAALSYARARPSLATAQLLREYVAWEQNPMLRHRGASVLRRLESSLA